MVAADPRRMLRSPRMGWKAAMSARPAATWNGSTPPDDIAMLRRDWNGIIRDDEVGVLHARVALERVRQGEGRPVVAGHP